MIRRGSKRSKYARRDRDFQFMGWVRLRVCSVRVEPPDPNRAPTPCNGPVEADHMGAHGLGQKADDNTCAPLCQQHHRERTDHSGSFRHLTRDEARAWRARAIERTQAAWSTVKKTNSKTAATCEAVASGGHLVCKLERNHSGAHSTAQPVKGKKPTQHATWIANTSGQVTVTTFSRGKKQSDWTESDPAAAGAAVEPWDCVEESDDPRPPWLREQTEQRDAEGRDVKPANLIDLCTRCGREIGEHDGKKCPPAAKPKPMTLEDEPEDDEPSEAALRALDQEDEHDPFVEPSPTAISSPGTSTKPTRAPVKFKDVKVGIKRVDVVTHPAADEFPMIEGDAFVALREDIRAHGVRQPIVLASSELVLVDGRNRLRACVELGIDPPVIRLDEDEDEVEFVISTNLHRRHLTESQRAMIAAAIANLDQGRPSKTGTGAGLTQEAAAKQLQVSERSVRSAKRIIDDGDQKVVDAVKSGRVTVKAAAELVKLPKGKQREILEQHTKGNAEIKSGKMRTLAKQEEKRAVVQKINKEQVRPMPIGPFRLIVVDPPWPYDNSDQHEGSRGHIPYPPMSLEDICRMGPDLDKLAHEEGCILGLWVTNAFIHEIGRLLTAWSFEPWTNITWDKGRMGMGSGPRGQTEHLYLARRGTPVHTLNDITTYHHEAPRQHSRKPEGLMVKLEKHCPGPFVELFSREPRPNWASWGAESDGSKAIEPKRKSKILTDTDKRVGSAA